MKCPVTGIDCGMIDQERERWKGEFLRRCYAWLGAGSPIDEYLGPVIPHDPEFERLWESWPVEGRFRKPDCARMFAAIRKAGKLPAFRQACQDYSDYIKAQRVGQNFNQRPQFLLTFMRTWEGDAPTYARVAARRDY